MIIAINIQLIVTFVWKVEESFSLCIAVLLLFYPVQYDIQLLTQTQLLRNLKFHEQNVSFH